MEAHKNHQPAGVVAEAKNAVGNVQKNPWIDRLTRVGYAVRGLIYGLMGYLAFRTIIPGGGRITDQNGVLATIASKPFGKIVLIVIAVGLVGLLIWGIVRAIADPYRKGDDMKGIVARAGYFISGLSYGALLIPTMNLIRGSSRGTASSTQKAQQVSANILTKPYGPALVGLVGIILVGVGISRIVAGLRADLHERLKSYEMTAEQRRWAIRLGRFGYIAIGIVFIIIGALAVIGAATLNPRRITGFDGALTFLAHQSYGPFLLVIVALGLIAFAIYSIMGALWFRIKEL